MRAVDTNVLVRLLMVDDAGQARAAELFVAHGVWVSHVVLAETTWVLRSVYGQSPLQIADALEAALDWETLTFEDAGVVAVALQHYRARPSLKFSDCLIAAIARRAGHTPIGTFDKEFAKVDDVERIKH
ncbi:MAG: type II toxin-antitoxin system VapC family toxin [Alphaproteobacteria bacterium]|nr:type II toxin-antitoxin system VapC family toxin [Alphaproteobacteria bacterium]